MDKKETEIKEVEIQEKGKSPKTKTLLVLPIIAMLVMIALFVTLHFYISKINIVDEGSAVISNLFNGSRYEREEDSHGEEVSKKELARMQHAIDQNVAKKVVSDMYEDDVINILLIGSDMRVIGSSSRSDTMILLSVNKATKEITVTSFMRDIYLQIPGYGYNRINAAYSHGVPQTVLDTIEQNFKIKVDKFVDVNFYTFIDFVDDLGGVTVNIDKNDIDYINESIKEENHYLRLPSHDGLLTSGGRMNLNGKRTLAYVRNRDYVDGDFTRTENQRAVVTQLSYKIFDLNIEEANKLLSKYLPLVTTNVSEREMYSLLLYLKEFSGYKINQICVPSTNSFSYVKINGMSVLKVDFNKNIDQITKTIYGDPTGGRNPEAQ